VLLIGLAEVGAPGRTAAVVSHRRTCAFRASHVDGVSTLSWLDLRGYDLESLRLGYDWLPSPAVRVARNGE